MEVQRRCVRRGCGRQFTKRNGEQEDRLLKGLPRPAFAPLYCDKCVIDRAKVTGPPIVEKRA